MPPQNSILVRNDALYFSMYLVVTLAKRKRLSLEQKPDGMTVLHRERAGAPWFCMAPIFFLML